MTPTHTILVAVLAIIATGCILGLGASSAPGQAAPATAPVEVAMPETHHGAWAGPNRLWMVDPDKPDRGDGTLDVAARTIRYAWTRGDTQHQGIIQLAGQPAALRCDWTDDFHAANGMTLHGYQREGVVHLYGTYPAGEGQPDWGWQIELDTRDREAFVIRMFNVVPGHGPMPAVVLHGSR